MAEQNEDLSESFLFSNNDRNTIHESVQSSTPLPVPLTPVTRILMARQIENIYEANGSSFLAPFSPISVEKVNDLEQKLDTLKKDNSLLRAEVMSEQEEKFKLEKTNEENQNKLFMLRQSLNKYKEDISKLRVECDEKCDFENEVVELRQKNKDLQTRFDAILLKLNETKMEITTRKEETQDLKGQIRQFRVEQSRSKCEIDSLQRNLEDLQALFSQQSQDAATATEKLLTITEEMKCLKDENDILREASRKTMCHKEHVAPTHVNQVQGESMSVVTEFKVRELSDEVYDLKSTWTSPTSSRALQVQYKRLVEDFHKNKKSLESFRRDVKQLNQGLLEEKQKTANSQKDLEIAERKISKLEKQAKQCSLVQKENSELTEKLKSNVEKRKKINDELSMLQKLNESLESQKSEVMNKLDKSLQELATKEKKIQFLLEQLESHKSELSQVASEIAGFSSKLDVAASTLAHLQDENSILNTRKDDLEEKLSRTTGELKQQELAKEQIELELTTSQKKMKELENESEVLKTQIVKTRKEMTDLQNENGNLLRKLKASELNEKDLREILSVVEAERDDLEEKLSSATGELKQQELAKEQIELKLTTGQKKIKELENESEVLKTQIVKTRKEMADLQNENGNLLQNLKTSELTEKGLRKILSIVEAERDSLREDINAKIVKIANIDAEAKKSAETLGQLRSALDTQQDKFDKELLQAKEEQKQGNDVIESLETQLKTHRKETEALKEQCSALECRIASANVEKEDLLQKGNDLSVQIKVLEGNLQEQQAEAASLKYERDDAVLKVEAATLHHDEEKATTQAQCSTLSDSLNQLTEENKQLKDKATALQADYDQLRSDFDRVLSELMQQISSETSSVKGSSSILDEQLQQNLADVMEAISNLKQSSVALVSENKQMQESVTRDSDSALELRSKIDILQSAADAELKIRSANLSEIADLKERNLELLSQLKLTNEKTSELESNLVQLNATRKVEVAKSSRESDQIETLSADVIRLNADRKDYLIKLQDTEQAMLLLKEKYGQLEVESNGFKTDLTTKQTECERIKTELQSERHEISEMKGDIEALQSQLDFSANQLKTKSDKIEILSTENEAISESVAVSQTKLMETEQKCLMLKEDLDKSVKDLASKSEEYEELSVKHKQLELQFTASEAKVSETDERHNKLLIEQERLESEHKSIKLELSKKIKKVEKMEQEIRLEREQKAKLKTNTALLQERLDALRDDHKQLSSDFQNTINTIDESAVEKQQIVAEKDAKILDLTIKYEELQTSWKDQTKSYMEQLADEKEKYSNLTTQHNELMKQAKDLYNEKRRTDQQLLRDHHQDEITSKLIRSKEKELQLCKAELIKAQMELKSRIWINDSDATPKYNSPLLRSKSQELFKSPLPRYNDSLNDSMDFSGRFSESESFGSNTTITAGSSAASFQASAHLSKSCASVESSMLSHLSNRNTLSQQSDHNDGSHFFSTGDLSHNADKLFGKSVEDVDDMTRRATMGSNEVKSNRAFHTRPSLFDFRRVMEEPDDPNYDHTLHRVAELQRRNSKQLAHMKSSYPIETQGRTPSKCDEAVRMGDSTRTLRRISELHESSHAPPLDSDQRSTIRTLPGYRSASHLDPELQHHGIKRSHLPTSSQDVHRSAKSRRETICGLPYTSGANATSLECNKENSIKKGTMFDIPFTPPAFKRNKTSKAKQLSGNITTRSRSKVSTEAENEPGSSSRPNSSAKKTPSLINRMRKPLGKLNLKK